MNERLVRAAYAVLLLPCLALVSSTADATANTNPNETRDSRPHDPLEPRVDTAESRTLYTLGQLISRTLDGFALTAEELRVVRLGLEDGVLGKPPKVDLSGLPARSCLKSPLRRAFLLPVCRAPLVSG